METKKSTHEKIVRSSQPRPIKYKSSLNLCDVCYLTLDGKHGYCPHSNAEGTAMKPYCSCRKKINGSQMIECNAKDCEIGLFHLSCIGLTSVPSREWFCPACKNQEKNIASSKSVSPSDDLATQVDPANHVVDKTKVLNNLGHRVRKECRVCRYYGKRQLTICACYQCNFQCPIPVCNTARENRSKTCFQLMHNELFGIWNLETGKVKRRKKGLVSQFETSIHEKFNGSVKGKTSMESSQNEFVSPIEGTGDPIRHVVQKTKVVNKLGHRVRKECRVCRYYGKRQLTICACYQCNFQCPIPVCNTARENRSKTCFQLMHNELFGIWNLKTGKGKRRKM